MKTWLVLILILVVLQVSLANEESRKFITIGSFSNMKYTEEHQYGAEVQLWEEDHELVGLFSYSEGLMGDTPIGKLEDIRYDRLTGDISFRARLTIGLHFCKVHKNVPSQDLFSFRGKLSHSSMSGVLKHSDALHPEIPSSEETVVLKKSAGERAEQMDYRSRSEWEAALREILKFRGPKW